jgi:hypothetical protein
MPDPVDPGRQQELALLGLLDQLWNDPEQGAVVRQRAKALNPNIKIPEDHPAAVAANKKIATMEETLGKLSEEFTTYRTSVENERAETSLRRQLGEVQTRFGLTDEGMQGTIKLMQDRHIADPEAAALLYQNSLPKPKPTSGFNRMFDTRADLFGTTRQDDAWEKLHTDPDGFFNDVVNQVFTEMPIAA